MKIFIAIAAVAALNLALAGLLLSRKSNPTPTLTNSKSDSSETNPPSASTKNPAPTPPKKSAPSKSDSFQWNHLDARNLHQYVADLREIQCPEETIQDIIIAEVNRLYAGKEASLGLVRHKLKPWEFTDATGPVNFDKYSQLRDLRREKQALLKELLGVDIPVEMPEGMSRSSNQRLEAALNHLPEEKRGPTRDIQLAHWEAAERLRQKVDGIYLPEDVEEYHKALRQRREALSAVLSPQELEDFELRTSVTATRLKSSLSAFEPTESEFRALFRQQLAFDEKSVPGQIAGDGNPFFTAQSQAMTEMEPNIRTALGESRYAEYKRTQDYTYRMMFDAVPDATQAKGVAERGYEIVQAFRGEFGRLASEVASNQNLTDDQRRAMYAQFQAQQDEQLRQLLGDEGFKKIQNRLPRYSAPRSRRGNSTPPPNLPVPIILNPGQ